MKTSHLLLFVFAMGVFVAHADDEKFPRLKVGGDTYTNVTVTSVTATDIYFISDAGMANAKLKELSPQLQKHFHYNARQAAAIEEKLAEGNAQYHEQLARQPAVKSPDMTREPEATPAPTGLTWSTDYPDALKQAQADDKFVLLDFTGSDWCGWCMKFDRDVLSTAKFAAYAGKKLKLVKLDFPQNLPQSEELKRANAALGKQFHVDGFPTFVLVNSDGRELGRQVGYLKGGPDAFIAELESFIKS